MKVCYSCGINPKDTLPPKLNARQRKAFVTKFGKDFAVEKDLLIYKPLNLIAIPSNNEKQGSRASI